MKWILGIILLLTAALPPAGRAAIGTFSATYLGGGNYDGTIGLTNSKTYLNAVNLNGGTLTINGVNFAASAGGNPSGSSWYFTGLPSAHAGGGTLPGGVLGTLVNPFIYDGKPGKFTLTNLTVGQTYVLTFYARSWGAGGTRKQNFTTTSGATTVYDGDMIGTAQGQANLLRYVFVASANNEVLTITPQNTANSMHTYGFSTEQVFNKAWVSGANWTTATWSPAGVPNWQGANAMFTAQGAPTTMTLDAPQTVGYLQFDGANAWTLNGATLTLNPDVGGTAVISTPSGTHTILAPLSLSADVIKTGAGSLNISNSIPGNKNLTISEGTLTLGNGPLGGGNYGGVILNNGTLVYGGSAAQSLSSISGTGGLTHNGSSTLALSGVNTYTGPTTVGAGTLKLSNSVPFGATAYYTFENNVNDMSGNGFNGTAVGTPTYAAGKVGQAIVLNGTSQYVTVPYSASLGVNAYTISLWVNIAVQPAVGGYYALVSTRNGGETTIDIQIGQSVAGINKLHADIGSGSAWINTAADFTLPGLLSGWNMITYTVGPGGYTIFTNGVQAATGLLNGGIPLLMKSGEELSFGAQKAGGATYGGFFNGSLDGVAIVGRALTSAEVSALYTSQYGKLPAATPVLIASGATLDLNGQSQTVASLADVAGAGGTVTNTVANTATLTLAPTATTSFSGVIQNGSGTTYLTIAGTGAGNQGLSGANTFRGELNLAGGILNVASLNNYGTPGPLGNRVQTDEQAAGTIIGLHFTGGTLQYTGSTPTSTDRQIRILNGAKTFIDASGTGSGTMSFTYSNPNTNFWDTGGTRTVTLTGSNTGDNTFAINIKSHSSGATSLAKTGAGKWLVTNPHNSDAQTDANPAYGGYTGGTTIGGGTLAFASGALGSVGTIAITNNAVLQWSGVNSQDLSARLRVEDGMTATFDTVANNVTFAVPLTLGGLKTAALVKAGSGALTLRGANTYTGGTLISNGTLQLGDGTADGSVFGNITNNGALVLVNASALTNGTISGTGTFTKSGNGSFTVTGGNSCLGATAINGGRLNVSTIASFPNSAVTFAGGTTNALQILSAGGQWTCSGLTFGSGTTYADLDFGIIAPSASTAPIQVNGDLTINGTLQFIVHGSAVPAGTYPLITCTGTLLGTVPATVLLMPSRTTATLSQDANNIYMTVSSTQPLTWQPGDSFWDITTQNWKDKDGNPTWYIDGVPGDSVVFDDTAAGPSPITVTLDSLFNPASVTANLTNMNYTITGLGGITGGTVLFKNGPGTLTMLGTNTFVGQTFLSGGTLQLGDGTTRNGFVPGNITNNAALVFANPGDQTYAGAVSGTGSLTKTSAGTLTLAGTNSISTYSGPTIVSGGTLKLAKSDANVTLGVPATSSFISDVNCGIGTASPFGASDYTHALAFGSGASVTVNGQTFAGTGSSRSGAGWSTTNWNNGPTAGSFPAGFQPSSGQANSLLNSFIYGVGGAGYVQTLVITGLTPGQAYDARIYYRAFGTVNTISRFSNWAFDPGTGTTSSLLNVNEDGNATGNILEFAYVAGPNGTLTMYATNQMAGSWHLYGFSNQKIQRVGGPISLATAVSIGTGATLDLNGCLPTIRSLADIGGVGGLVTNSSALGAGLNLSLSGGSTTFSGAIPGGLIGSSISLSVGGSGSQTLGGGTLLAGPLTVSNSAILNLIGSNLMGGRVTIGSGAALNVDGTNICSTTVSNAGILSLAGYNLFSNGLSVSPGATLNVGGTNWIVGGYVTDNGTFNITNDLTVVGAGYFYVGISAGSASMVNQVGGTVNLGQVGYSLLLGNTGVGNVGIYNLFGGTLNVTNNLTMGVNPNTSGTLNITNGTLTALGLMDVGRSDGTANTTNTFRMSGGSARVGTLNIAPSTTNICSFAITNASFAASAFNYLGSGNGSVAHLALGPGAKVVLPPFPTARGGGAVADITFDGGTLSPSVGSGAYLQGLTGAYLTANGAIFDVTNNITVAQTLSDYPSQSGTLTKNGPGTLIMSGSSTYSGLTLVNNGTLAYTIVPQTGGAVTVNSPGALGVVGSTPGATLGMSTLTLNAGSTIGFGIYSVPTAALMTATNLAVNGLVNVAISGGLPVGATGTFPLLKLINGDISTYGPFQLTALPVGITGTLVTNTLNNTLDLNVTDVAALTSLLTWTGATNGNWDLITTNWQRSGTAGNYNELVPPGDSVLFDDTLVSNPTVSLTSGLWPLSVTVSNINTNYDFGGSGRISGGAYLTKLGLGRLTLATDNNYTGGTVVSAGTLQIGNGAAVGSVVGLIINNGTVTFDRGNTAYTVNNNITGSGTTVFQGGNGSMATATTLGAGIGINTATVQIGGTSFGWLNFGAANQINGTSGSLVNFTGGRINLMGYDQTVSGLTGGNNCLIQLSENTAIGSANLILNVAGGNSYVCGPILIRDYSSSGGKLGFIKNGTGTQELDMFAGYSHTGPTIINDGMLILNAPTFSSAVTINSPGALGLDGNWVLGTLVSGNGRVVKRGTNVVALSNAGNTYSGGTVVSNGTLRLDGGSGLGTGPGQTSSAGALDANNIIRIENGATLMGNVNAVLGNSGILAPYSQKVIVNQGGRFYTGSGAFVQFIWNPELNGGIMEAGPGYASTWGTALGILGTVTVGGTSASSIIASGTGANANVSLSRDGTTTFDVADVAAGTDLKVSSVLRNWPGVVSGLTKTGPGTMELTAANTYTGDTIVNNGTLKLGTNAPLLYMSFDSVGGTTVTNEGAGGSAMNGLLVGAGAYIVPGRRGNALLIGGDGSKVVISNRVAALDGNSSTVSWTLGLWLKTATAGAGYAYQGDGAWASGNTAFYLNQGANVTNSSNTRVGGVRHSGGFLTGTAAVNDNNWHFVAIVVSNGLKTIYVDGAVDATIAAASGWTTASTGNQFWIGGTADPGDGVIPMTGLIDEVYVFNSALSQGQVQTLMNVGGNSAGADSSIVGSPNINVGGGATLDVSALSSGYTVRAAQTLKGNNAFNVLGTLTNQGTIELKLSKAGGVTANDSVNGLTSITYGGTLRLLVSGEPFAATDTFKLFSAGSYYGNFPSIVGLPGPGLAWDTSTLATDGTLRLRMGITGLYSTGVDDSGALAAEGSADLHFQLVASADPAYPGPQVLVMTNNVWPVGGGAYMTNGPISSWISPGPNGANNAVGDYVYRTSFMLDTLDPATARIEGRWASDNGAMDIRLNGVSLGISNPNGFLSFTSFIISSGFVAGSNSLEFVVHNDAPPGPTALRVEMSGTGLPYTATPPLIVNQPADTTVFEGQNAYFSVGAAGSAPLSYQWWYTGPRFEAFAWPDATNRSPLFSTVSRYADGYFVVVVTNAYGAITSAPARLTVLVPVTGTVTLEAYEGLNRDGVGQRDVAFAATDTSTFTNRYVQTLNFGVGGVGSYSNNVPFSTTRFSAKTAWTLRQAWGGVDLDANPVVDFTLLAGDINGSNKIDINDYYLLASRWYTSAPDADIDGSGKVDLDDYFILTSHWDLLGDAE